MSNECRIKSTGEIYKNNKQSRNNNAEINIKSTKNVLGGGVGALTGKELMNPDNYGSTKLRNNTKNNSYMTTSPGRKKHENECTTNYEQHQSEPQQETMFSRLDGEEDEFIFGSTPRGPNNASIISTATAATADDNDADDDGMTEEDGNPATLTAGAGTPSALINATPISIVSTNQVVVNSGSSLQNQKSDQNESDFNISSCSTLDIDVKVKSHEAEISQDRINDLMKKLSLVEKERNELKRRLNETLEERDQSFRRLDAITLAHESRLTEMHCVIAELTKKLRSKQENTIIEEQELEGSEFSFHEGGSLYNNSESNITNSDAGCQTEQVEANIRSSDFNTKIIASAANDSIVKTQMQALQEEVLHLKAQIALLQSQIANNITIVQQEDEENQCYENQIILSPGDSDDDVIGDDDCDDNNDGVCNISQPESFATDEDGNLHDNDGNYESFPGNKMNMIGKGIDITKSTLNHFADPLLSSKNFSNTAAATRSNIELLSSNTKDVNNLHQLNNISSKRGKVMMTTTTSGATIAFPDVPIPKKAERVRLKRNLEEQQTQNYNNQYQYDCHHNITGNDVLSNELKNAELVLSDIMQHDDGSNDYSTEAVTANIVDLDNSFQTCQQLKDEFQRLQRRIEQYKYRNTILTWNLEECKEHCEHLYLLCGKYESNAIALQLALNCSDRAIEAYDVMLALLESKLGLIRENTSASQESRKAVEAVARHLLERLESEKNLNENSLGPWQNTVCINNDEIVDPWTPEDDNRLRNHVSKLKGRRSAVQNTIVNLESPFSTQFEKIRKSIKDNIDLKLQQDNTNMDIEMAVLMQELSGLREDVIDANRKLTKAEKDKNDALQRVIILEETLANLQSQLTVNNQFNSLEINNISPILNTMNPVTGNLMNSQQQQQQQQQDRISSFSEAEHAALIERQLIEALTRESQLKNRIQTLINSVTSTAKHVGGNGSMNNQVTVPLGGLSLGTGCLVQKSNNISCEDVGLTGTQNKKRNQILEQREKKYFSKLERLEKKISQMNIERNDSGKQQNLSPHHHQHSHLHHHHQQRQHQPEKGNEFVPEMKIKRLEKKITQMNTEQQGSAGNQNHLGSHSHLHHSQEKNNEFVPETVL